MNIKLKGGALIALPFDQSKIDAWTPPTAASILSRLDLLEENQQEDMKLCVALGMYLASQTANGGKAELTQMKTGRSKGQWRFKLVGANGEPVEPTNERYHNRQDALDTLNKYFPGFEIV